MIQQKFVITVLSRALLATKTQMPYFSFNNFLMFILQLQLVNHRLTVINFISYEKSQFNFLLTHHGSGCNSCCRYG